MFKTSHRKRVAVLRGGPSPEYDVSMRTGFGVISALRKAGYEVKDIIISQRGEWLVCGFVKDPERALIDVDTVFIALHGTYGEDGTVQRILERLCIPYTGSSSYASAIAMNKALTKEYLKKQSDKVKMPPHLKLTRTGSASLAQTVGSIAELFGPEYVVKPVGGGSSINTVLCNKADLLRTVQNALEFTEEVLVEKRIIGKEATVGIVENFRGSKYYQLPVIEIIPPVSASFFSNEAKYSGEAQEICPGRFSRQEKQELGLLAEEIHTLLGLKQYSRSDFIVADDGIYFLEANSLPCLAEQSLFVTSLESVGSNLSELAEHLLVVTEK